MTRELTVAVVQMDCTEDPERNVRKAEDLVRSAGERGAQVVLLPELFESRYFCVVQDERHFRLAHDAGSSKLLRRFSSLAAELGVVLPVSFFEKAGQAHYNSVAVLDADGSSLGIYRKSHIPDGPGYQEKFYFRPGDTGFRVFDSRYGRLGVAICWDQWFPEAARTMVLDGAELLLYPTAIGSEPVDPDLDTREAWTRAMQGHAAANRVPVAAANRYGEERIPGAEVTFYGSSFIAGPDGGLVERMEETGEGVALATFDLDRLAQERAGWGFFRDRRPELYGRLGEP